MRCAEVVVKGLLLGLWVLGNGAFADGSVAAGKQAYLQCISCHGAEAEGNAALLAPSLAQLPPVYLLAQLQKFRSGQRGGAEGSVQAQQMAAIATALQPQTLMNLALYIDTLPAPAPAATLSGDANLGADYYNQYCGACHGGAAQGNTLLQAPPLAGSEDWYLLAQLTEFQRGARGGSGDNRSGKQMRAMASTLPSEQAVLDVLAFISSLPSR